MSRSRLRLARRRVGLGPQTLPLGCQVDLELGFGRELLEIRVIRRLGYSGRDDLWGAHWFSSLVSAGSASPWTINSVARLARLRSSADARLSSASTSEAGSRTCTVDPVSMIHIVAHRCASQLLCTQY